MEIKRNIEVPTGNILIVEGQWGPLELLSLGDYGKAVNLKADFMGLTRDIEPVKHQQMLPLEEKWVITISTQYGCSMNCTFCDVPKVGPGINATFEDLVDQFLVGLALHPEVAQCKHLNVHFARMGEPTWNSAVLTSAITMAYIAKTKFGSNPVHPVVSTMMPKRNENLMVFLREWMRIKNEVYGGNAGLQLSINSTDENERAVMFSNNALTLEQINYVMLNAGRPKGRKITLNFAVAGYTIDPQVLLNHFDPQYYVIKLTPMHKTSTALENGIKTGGDYTEFYPYQEHEAALKAAGYDVLVFIASQEEDMGRITCGNAILSGTLPEGVPFRDVPVVRP